jgi:hypothetical protein
MTSTYHQERQYYHGIEDITRREAAVILHDWRANPCTYQVARVAKGHYIAINAARGYSLETIKIGGAA